VSQTGFPASVQCELVRHATHLFVASLQIGVLPVHLPLHGSVVAGAVDVEVPPVLDELDFPPALVPPFSALAPALAPASPPLLLTLVVPPSVTMEQVLVFSQSPARFEQAGAIDNKSTDTPITLVI
jgi:hypothetical protein